MSTLEKILTIIKSDKFYGPIVVIVISLITYKIISRIIENISFKGKSELDNKKRLTIVLLFRNIFKYILVIIVVVLILGIYDIDTTSLVAGLGIAGVVIGLALQDALKDIIAGISIIMDNYYVVGDLVEYNGFTGTIYEFGLKSTKIKGNKGDMLIIANRNIDKIINLSKKRTMLYLEIPTAYEESHKKVEKVLNSALEELKKNSDVIANDTKYLGINEFSGSNINYMIQIKCNQGTHYAVKREAFRIIKEAYEKNNIKIPYNQIEVHHGQDI